MIPVETAAKADMEIGAEDYLLEIVGMSKAFPGVKALDDVNFQLKYGEIHGLVGENGAGKSTLLKILSGVHQSDSGVIKLEGRPVVFKNPSDAQKKGICMEYQEKTSFPNLNVGENIVVGNWSECAKNKKSPIVAWKNIHDEAEKILKTLNFEIDTKSMMSDLSAEKQQIVQIARSVALKGKILILDEPTAAISFSQVEKLFQLLRKLRDEGYSIIYVSHHLKEVFRITDRVTILKDGQHVGTYETSSLDEKEMIRLMVGRTIEKAQYSTSGESEPVLTLSGLSSKSGDLQDVSLTVHKGEILGVAGLVGSGKDMLARAIAGLLPLSSGRMELSGKPFVTRSPKQTIRRGVFVLPAERSLEGLVLAQNLSFNMTLSCFKRFSKYNVMNNRTELELSDDAAKKVNLRFVSLQQAALLLSGGNQQRLMIARSFLTNAEVIVFNEPTQGVDVGAKEEIHKLIHDYAAQGGAVLLISSELTELLSNSNRILVMSRGKLVAEYAQQEATEESLLENMIG